MKLTIKEAKGNFFDRQHVLDLVDKAKVRVLSKFGAFVRQRARTSIRRRKGTSPAGGAPYSHLGLLKQFLFFAYDPGKDSVVIGPALIRNAGTPTVPELLEYGGAVQGDGRTIFISNDVARDKSTGRFTSSGKTKVELTGTIRYKPRPYMGPALQAELPGLEGLWKDSIR